MYTFSQSLQLLKYCLISFPNLSKQATDGMIPFENRQLSLKAIKQVRRIFYTGFIGVLISSRLYLGFKEWYLELLSLIVVAIIWMAFWLFILMFMKHTIERK